MSSFHPRRTDREIEAKDEIGSIMKHGKYAVIGMSRKDEPYVVTLSYGYDEQNGRLYFHCAPKGMKLDFIAENPYVCATVIEDRGYVEENCEHLFSSLVIRGKMRDVKELTEKKHGLDVLLHHLEDDPATIKERNIKDDSSYDKVVILSLDITSIVGKHYK